MRSHTPAGYELFAQINTNAVMKTHVPHATYLPPVMNMPGADGTQAKHWTDAAAEGKQKDVMHARPSLSTSLMPLWRFDTVAGVKHVMLGIQEASC